MSEPNSPSRISNNPNIWVKCSTLDTNKDLSSFSAELSDSKDDFHSLFGVGQLRILSDKIVFSQGDYIVAFISFCEELIYSTLYEQEKSSFLKFAKYGKETFVLLDKTSLDDIDLLLKKILFKQDFALNYEIQSFIGNGSFSQVTLAKNKRNEKNYAIKSVQKSRITASAQNKKELMNEINILRRLNHDKVLKAYEFYSSENAFKMVLEYYSGGTLEQKLEQSPGISLFHVCEIIKQVLQGFAYLHSLNIVHRDLKPDNVLFLDTDSFDVVISDVGLSQEISEEFIFTKCGTPGYVAPEILNSQNGRDYGVISDIFSCGALFYRLAVGKPLFQGKSHVEVLEENKKCKIDLQCPEFLSIPQQIQKLIERMLSVNPENRITAQESLDSLFYRLNQQQSDYFCKNTLFKTIQHKRKDTLNSHDSQKILSGIQHKQRRSVQHHPHQESMSYSPKTSSSQISQINHNALTKMASSINERTEIKKSSYKKQSSQEQVNVNHQKPTSPFKRYSQNSTHIKNTLTSSRITEDVSRSEQSNKSPSKVISPKIIPHKLANTNKGSQQLDLKKLFTQQKKETSHPK